MTDTTSAIYKAIAAMDRAHDELIEKYGGVEMAREHSLSYFGLHLAKSSLQAVLKELPKDIEQAVNSFGSCTPNDDFTNYKGEQCSTRSAFESLNLLHKITKPIGENDE